MKRLLFIMCLFVGLGLRAQNDTAYIYTYGGASDDEGKDIIQTSDGGYLIVGSTSSFGNGSSDIYAVKIDSNFQTQWTAAYGGPQIESGEAVLSANDGGYYLIGYTNSFGSGGYDVYMVKIDSLGNKDWDDYYGGANWDFAYDAVSDSLGNIYIVGESYSFSGGDAQAYVLKLDEFGSIIWEKDFGGDKDDLARGICQTSDDNLVFTGENSSLRDTGSTDVWLLKFNYDGEVKWNNVYGGNKFDAGYAVTYDSAHFYIAGSSRSYSLENDLNEFVIKVDSGGALVWYQDRKQNGNGPNLDDEGFGIGLRPNGRILVTGAVRSFGSGSSDIIISDLGTSGFESAESGSFGEYLSDIGYKIFAQNNSDLFILGKTNNFGSEYFNVALLYMDTIFKFGPTDIKVNPNYIDTSSKNTALNIEYEPVQESSISVEYQDQGIVINNNENLQCWYQLTSLDGRIVDNDIIERQTSRYISLNNSRVYLLLVHSDSQLISKRVSIIE